MDGFNFACMIQLEVGRCTSLGISMAFLCTNLQPRSFKGGVLGTSPGGEEAVIVDSGANVVGSGWIVLTPSTAA